MNGDRFTQHLGSFSTSQSLDPGQQIVTVSVVGLSGPNSSKVPHAVGKSALCNRLVRPEHASFQLQHISHLSQADFSGSPVINSDHWLYWGEAELDHEYRGRVTHIRVIEQTEFIDDETFEPLRATRMTEDYVKRALKTTLESRGKTMYICPDQVGVESDFDACLLPNGKANIDAFLLVYDVSRSVPGQFEFASSLIQNAAKVKKPVFLVASKCDALSKSYEGMSELQRLVKKKECKHVNPHIVETSAKHNVNCTELLRFVASTLEKSKTKQKLQAYPEALELQTARLKEIRDDFISLMTQLLPREEWPRRQNQLNWRTLVNDFGFAYQPAYMCFARAFGAKEAEQLYEQHMRRSREWWTAKEQREKLPTLRSVLLEFFDESLLMDSKWEDVVYETERHPMFDRYFKPVGQSLDRYIYHLQDTRIPAELLQTYDAQHMFFDLQKEISNKAILEAQTERFTSFLTHKEAVIPGRKYSDAKLLIGEIETYEQFLPNGLAEQAYLDYQKALVHNAERNFLELLQERLPIFAAYAILKYQEKMSTSGQPGVSLDSEMENYFVEALQDDKRFRAMSCLPEKRRKILQRYANFIIHPLDDFCPSNSFCINRQLSKIIHSVRSNFNKYNPVDVVVYGEDYLVDDFMDAVNMSLSADRLFDYDSGVAKISCYKHDSGFTSSRVRSVVCVVNSLDAMQQFLAVKWSAAPGLAPLFVTTTSPATGVFYKQVSQIADKIGGVYISDDNLSETESDPTHALTSHFHLDQVQRVLREVCHAQLCGSYADLRVQFSFMCGDVFKPDAVLSVLLDQANHANPSGNIFTLDQHLPKEKLNVRIRIDAVAYHSWLLSTTGWPMNSINGHVLIYSTVRIASWHHAEMAARMLVKAAGPSLEEKHSVGKSIFILAVDDANNCYNTKNSQWLLSMGSRLAAEIGATFATLSPNLTSSSHLALFVDYFESLFVNDPLPDNYYFPMSVSTTTLTLVVNDGNSLADEDDQRRVYTTLESTASTASHESNDSGASVVSVNDLYVGRQSPALRRRKGVARVFGGDPHPGSQASPRSQGSAASCSSRSSGGGGGSGGGGSAVGSQGHGRGRENRLLSQSSMRHNPSESGGGASSAPLAKPEFTEMNNELYGGGGGDPYVHGDPCCTLTDVTRRTGTEKSSSASSTALSAVGKTRKIDKLLPKIGCLIMDSSTTPGATTVSVPADPDAFAGSPNNSGVVEMFVNGTRCAQGSEAFGGDEHNVTTVTIATMERPEHLADKTVQIRFCVNGNDDHHPHTQCPHDGAAEPSTSKHHLAGPARLPYQIRSHSSESVFLEANLTTDPAFSESSSDQSKEFLHNRRVIGRQGSLRENKNRSYSRGPSGKRSFFGAANETSTSLAHKFVASFRSKNRSTQVLGSDGVEILSVSRLDSFGNPCKRTGPAIPTLQLNNVPKKSGLAKTSSAVSNALSWLPNRSQKRSPRTKSEGVDQFSSSPSPVDTLQSLCDADNTVNGVPLFAAKCISFIEENGGLELEGLYRVPGNQSQVAELEKRFRTNPNLDLAAMNLPLHVVATAVKKFFDTLPEPIIPVFLHAQIVRSVEADDSALSPRGNKSVPPASPVTPESFSGEYDQQCERLADVLRANLPPVNQHVLCYLSSHLRRVHANSHKTNMNLRNLAKIFGPTLFRPEFDSFERMTSQLAKFELAMFLIFQNCDQMFSTSL